MEKEKKKKNCRKKIEKKKFRKKEKEKSKEKGYSQIKTEPTIFKNSNQNNGNYENRKRKTVEICSDSTMEQKKNKKTTFCLLLE